MLLCAIDVREERVCCSDRHPQSRLTCCYGGNNIYVARREKGIRANHQTQSKNVQKAHLENIRGKPIPTTTIYQDSKCIILLSEN